MSQCIFGFITLIGTITCLSIQMVPVEKNVCNIPLSKIGCSNTTGGSPLNDILISDRDGSSGYLLNWKDFPSSISSLLCRCAQLAQLGGYTVFGIQYFGECWGSKQPLSSIIYNKKPSDDCRNVYYKPCQLMNSELCVGREVSTFLYTSSYAKSQVDGGYSEWSDWSTCSTTCGVGVQERARACDNPKPDNGGLNCYHLGDQEETRLCLNTLDCTNEGVITSGTCTVIKEEEYSKVLSSKTFAPATLFCVILDTRSHWKQDRFNELLSYTVSASLWNNKDASASFGLAYNAQDLNNYEFIYIRTISRGDLNPFCLQIGKVINGTIQWSGTYSCQQPLLSKQWIHLRVEVTSKMVTFTVNNQILVVLRPTQPFQSVGGVIIKDGLGSEVFYQNIMIEQILTPASETSEVA